VDQDSITVFDEGQCGDKGPFTLTRGGTYTFTLYLTNNDNVSTYQFRILAQ
jgi:hypothetical protein